MSADDDDSETSLRETLDREELDRRAERVWTAHDLDTLEVRPLPLLGDDEFDGDQLVLTEESITLLVGPPGSGKTTVAAGIAFSLAAGRMWLGRYAPSFPRHVLWVSGEGPRSMPGRYRAWKSGHDDVEIEPTSFALLSMPGLMSTKGAMSALGRVAIKNLDNDVGLLVIDTLSSAYGYGAEAHEHDGAAAVIASLSQFRTRHRCAVLLVHHTGWSNPRRARGSSALEADVDDVLVLSVNPDRTRTLVATKRRDSEIGAPITMTLTAVDGTGGAVFEQAAGSMSWSAQIVTALTTSPDGMTTANLRTALGIADRTAPGRSAFHSALSRLVADDVVVQAGRGNYRLTVGGGK